MYGISPNNKWFRRFTTSLKICLKEVLSEGFALPSTFKAISTVFFRYSLLHYALFSLFLALAGSISLQAQTITVQNPSGGFEIDGDLEANTPTSGVGDWIAGAAGSGGFILDNSGTPSSSMTQFIVDQFNTNSDNSFTSGSKAFDDPNTWTWANSSVTGKGDINNVLYHMAMDESTPSDPQQWLMLGADRRSTNGTSYIDFEFFQAGLTANPDFTFTSTGPDGGRTENDILLTFEYGNGGSNVSIYFYLWEPDGSGGFQYNLYIILSSDNAFGQTNLNSVSVPFGAFNDVVYDPYQFAEGGLNLTDIFGGLPDPCLGVTFSTVLVKTKNSTSPTAALNDFVGPISVGLTINTAEISYDPSVYCSTTGRGGLGINPNIRSRIVGIAPTITGVQNGTFSASPAGLVIDANTGVIDADNSNIGSYTITYTYTTNGCIKTTDTTFEIYGNPDAPISGGDQSECQQAPIQTLTASASVAAGESLVWYDAASGGNVVASPALSSVGTVIYYAESVNDLTSCTSLTRTAVSLTISEAPAAPISTGDISECASDPIQTLDANDAVTAVVDTEIVWYDAATGGNVVASPVLGSIGTITYWAEAVSTRSTTPFNDSARRGAEIGPNTRLVSRNGNAMVSGRPVNGSRAVGCTSLTRTPVTLTLLATPTAGITNVTGATELTCSVTEISLEATGGGSYSWSTGASTAGITVSTPGTYTVTVTSANGCTDTASIEITQDITAPNEPVSGGDQSECETDPIQTLTATATVGNGQILTWYDAAEGGNVVTDPSLSSVGSVTYYAESTFSATGCISLTRTPVNLTILGAPEAPISDGDLIECEEEPTQTLIASATVSSGEIITWYDAATGGDVVADPSLSSVGSVTYYAETYNFNSGCVSLDRTAVTLAIIAAPESPVSTGDLTGCDTGSNALDANDAIEIIAGEDVVWYDAPTGGIVITDPVLAEAGSVTYYAENINAQNGCSSLARTAVSLTLFDCQINLIKEVELLDAEGCSLVNDEILFTYTVANFGNTALSEIELSDPLLTDPNPQVDIEYLSGDDNGDGLLDVDELWLFSATYVITQSDLDNGVVSSTAAVNGTTYFDESISDLSHDVSFFEDGPTSIDICQDGRIGLIMAGVWNDLNNDLSANVGETITYTFSLINLSTIEVLDLQIFNDNVDVIIEGPESINLDAGQENTSEFTATYTITQFDIDRGFFETQSYVDGLLSGVTLSDLSDPESYDADAPTRVLLPSVGSQVDEIIIYNGVTPNGDGKNDFFWIENIDAYQGNTMQIYNRWGVLVWESRAYNESNNVFQGYANVGSVAGSGNLLPTGTYFYVLTFDANSKPINGETAYTGYLYLNR